MLTHFSLHMLPETNLMWVKTELRKEELDTSHEVSDRLVIDNTGLDCLTKGNRCGIGFTLELNVAVEKINLDMRDFMETVVFLPTFRIYVIWTSMLAK